MTGEGSPSQAEPVTGLLTVLLVEDNTGDARLVEEMLKDARREWEDDAESPDDVNLLHATTLSAGREHLGKRDVDVVLLDLGLPDSQGLDTLRAVLDETDHIPVIVLTGLPETELGVEAVREGAQDYLVKDEVSVETFVHTIQYALERTRTKRALRRTTQQLTILNQLMRHDIRNDISLVVGRAQELTEFVDPRGEDLLAEIITSSNHVLQLTRTIGDAVEMVTRKDADLETVDLARILDDELATARKLYGGGTIAVDGEVPPVNVRANRLLSAVFGNLLSNAMLHAGENGPEVEVGVDVAEETVMVRVADNGPGVPEARKEEIFGRGEHGAGSEGLGVGLYLVDRLVQQYEGDVWVEDNEPCGAVFNVRLHRADPSDDPSAESATETSQNDVE